jgi:hypothetical protein
MTLVQRLVMAIAPKSWGRAIREESERWLLRCPECRQARSVWEAGGIRFKALSVRRQVWAYCPQCGRSRAMSLAYVEK